MATCTFGTDGIRGQVGQEPMVPDTIVRLGYAIGTVLGGPGREVVVGKDTRLSGYMVESAIEAGLAAAGMNSALTGPLPTSAVAHLVAEESAAAGIVISASHNPFSDNGIKVFDAEGNKLSDEMEREIERLAAKDGPIPAWSSEPGKARRIDDATERYIDFCLGSTTELSLVGKHIVVDAANGAAYSSAPEIFRRAGAFVYELGCRPDGRNINVGCGALEPQVAAAIVRRHNFDLGVILDGDGDRLVLIDATGRILDGDACLHVIATCRHATGQALPGMVGTLMSNKALEDALGQLGAEFVRADVGDRNVARILRERGWTVGGESSGHLLLLDRHVTGDGIIAALAVLEALAAAGLELDACAAGYQPMPSVTRSVPTQDPTSMQSGLAAVVATVRNLSGVERVVLRPSGTEPVLRLLVEAVNDDQAIQAVAKITAEARRLGAKIDATS